MFSDIRLLSCTENVGDAKLKATYLIDDTCFKLEIPIIFTRTISSEILKPSVIIISYQKMNLNVAFNLAKYYLSKYDYNLQTIENNIFTVDKIFPFLEYSKRYANLVKFYYRKKS